MQYRTQTFPNIADLYVTDNTSVSKYITNAINVEGYVPYEVIIKKDGELDGIHDKISPEIATNSEIIYRKKVETDLALKDVRYFDEIPDDKVPLGNLSLTKKKPQTGQPKYTSNMLKLSLLCFLILLVKVLI